MRKKKITIPGIVRLIYLALNIIIMLFPLLFMFMCAFKTDAAITVSPFSLPTDFEAFKLNITDVINGTITVNGVVKNSSLTPFFVMLKNTVILTLVPMVLMLACATLCAYALGRLKFRIKKYVIVLILVAQKVPYFGYMYPMFFQLNFMGLLNNLGGVSLVYVAVSLPACIILMLGFFKSFPGAVEEAAVIDGANEFQKFVYIVLPMSTGIIGSMAIVNFMGYWNEFAIANLMLTSPENRTLNMGVFLMKSDLKGLQAKNYIFMLLTLSALPNLLFFTIFQKSIINGISLGSVKG